MIALETLLTDGFGYHDTQSARYAAELEAAAAQVVPDEHLARFLKVSTHTLGEHLGDWPRAVSLADAVLAGRTPRAATAAAWMHQSVARMLAGDPVGAAGAELAFLRGSGADVRPALIEARFALVAALVGAKRTAEATGLYADALALARQAGDAAPARAIAVASNNLAYDLVEAPRRSAEEDALMRLAADASHEFWLRCGSWRNEQAGHGLMARVALLLGEPDAAIAHVARGLSVIAANGPAPVEAGILRVIRAAALGRGGDVEAKARELAAADAESELWDDADGKAFYDDQRAWILGERQPSA
jgi:hypothetical protein